MPGSLPRRAWALLFALVVFAIVVLSVVFWANASGRAGSQRGLVIHSELTEPTIVRLADGREQMLGPERREYTFVIKREDFPSVIGVYMPAGDRLFEREFAYAYFAGAEFRLSYDARGFYPTTELRDRSPTPAP